MLASGIVLIAEPPSTLNREESTVPTAQYSSFDRGFDVEHDDTPRRNAPILDRDSITRARKDAPWKKVFAFGVVGVMVLAAFIAIAPALFNKDKAPAYEEPAHMLVGEKYITYKIDNMFWLGTKPVAVGGYSAYQELGHWNGTPGYSAYYDQRKIVYQEWFARSTYPYVQTYDTNAIYTTETAYAGSVLTSWYRLSIDAYNLTEMGTGPGKDPIFMPVMGTDTLPGGTTVMNWYSTYLTQQDFTDMRKAGNIHYANFHFGIDRRQVPPPAKDDGYIHELQGHFTFDRASAMRLLNLPGVGDLYGEFAPNQSAIETAWYNSYNAEATGIYDVYTGYDYAYGPAPYIRIIADPDYLTVNPTTEIHLRFYTWSWGNEVLFVRYMEKAGAWKFNQAYPDNWYLNMTIGPTQGDIHSRSVNGYSLQASKDMNDFIGAWRIETVHIDYVGNDVKTGHTGYTSPYNPYDPDQDIAGTNRTASDLPGTTRYGTRVNYFAAPQTWDLANEKLIIVLPSSSMSVPGYVPYRGASDTLDQTKMDEYYAHQYWGEMVMGDGFPNSGSTNLKNYYNPGTRTVTMVGPIDMPNNPNPVVPNINETGSPLFMFDVAKVSTFNLAIPGYSSPYPYGANLPLTVTAKNNTGATVTDWNGTALLSNTAGIAATFGASNHVYVPNATGDNGVWTTTIRWNSGSGTSTVNASEQNRSLEVNSVTVYTVNGLIPEFPTLLIPVIGAVALFVAFRRRDKKKA